MSNAKKVTRKEYFAAVRTLVENIESVGEYTADEVLAFIDNEVAKIDAKAAKAKEKAAEKKAETDETTEQVYEYLTDEYQTVDDILAKFDEASEMTKSKVVARLTNLVKANRAVKEAVKAEDGRKLMNYKRV